MINKLLKHLLALVCILLSLQCSTSAMTPDTDGRIVSYDSAFVVYKVHDGDYLSKIADEFGVPIGDIVKTNNLKVNDAMIYVGQILKIPTRGRTNEILEARKRRILYDKDNELQSHEKKLVNLHQRTKVLRYKIDSIKVQIKDLEEEEVLDKTIDENNMDAMLRQMKIAKEIGIEKKKLISTLEKTEQEFISTRDESKIITSDIENLQVRLEERARSYREETKKEATLSSQVKEEDKTAPSENVETSDLENPAEITNADEQLSSVSSNEEKVVPHTYETSEKEAAEDNSSIIAETIPEDSEVESGEKLESEIRMLPNYEHVESENDLYGSKEEFEKQEEQNSELFENMHKKPAIRKFDESSSPFEITLLEDKYEETSPKDDEEDVKMRMEEIKRKAIISASQKREEAAEPFRGEEQKPSFKSKKKPSQKSLKNKDHNFVQGAREYEEYELFRGLRDVDVSEELDSINIMKAKFYLARGLKEIDRGQYKRANKFISKSVKLSNNFLDAKVILADLNATFGYNEKAINLYDEAIELDTSMARLYYNRAHCYLNMGKNQQAFDDFTQAIHFDKKYILAYAGRASISVDINDFESAIEDYSRILKINNYFLPAYKGRGIAFMEIGNYEKAINDFNISLELSPRQAVLYYKRGLAKILTDRLFDACFDLWTASELGFRDAEKEIKRYCD